MVLLKFAPDVAFSARHMVTPDASAKFVIPIVYIMSRFMIVTWWLPTLVMNLLNCFYVKNDLMNNRACQHRKVRMSFLPSHVQFKVNSPAKTWKGCVVRFYCLIRKNRLYDGLLSVRNLNFRALRACYDYEMCCHFFYLAHTRRICYAVLWLSSYCCLLNQDGYLC